MEQQRLNVITGVTLVAVISGLAAAFLYTERGRESIRRLEDALDELGEGLQHLRTTVRKATRVVAEGMEVATEGMDAVTELGAMMADRRRASSPFRASHG